MVYGTGTKNVHFHNNQPGFNVHHSSILRACELSQGVYSDEIKLATGGVSVHLIANVNNVINNA